MARVHNSLSLSTAPVVLFLARSAGGTDGQPMHSFRVDCTAGSVRIWAEPINGDTTLSGVLLSAGGLWSSWSPISDVGAPFIRVTALGTSGSTTIKFRPEIGAR